MTGQLLQGPWPEPPPINTRPLTGLPSWPIGLVAGVEKSGKTLKIVEAATSELIHRCYWIGVGEDDPDEYGAFPGAAGKIDLVQHDGTYRGVLNALHAARLQPPGPGGEPNLLVLDSAGRTWDLLKDMAQAEQRARQAKRGDQAQIPLEGIKPTPDLWNTANDRWDFILDELRAHQGPVLVTARLQLQMIVDSEGKPTKEKGWQVLAQKNLPYDVGFIVQLRASYPEQDSYLTGVRSLRFPHSRDRHGRAELKPLADDWTIENIWRQLGLAETLEAQRPARTHARVTPVAEEAIREHRDALLQQIRRLAEGRGIPLAQVAADWANDHNGQPIGDTTDMGSLELLRDTLQAMTAHDVTPDPAAAAAPSAGGQVGGHASPRAERLYREPAAPPAAPPVAPPAAPPAGEQGPADDVDEVLAEVLAQINDASCVEDLRVVWRNTGVDGLNVRHLPVDDPRHGRLSVGELITRLFKDMPSEPVDHAQRAAGETVGASG